MSLLNPILVFDLLKIVTESSEFTSCSDCRFSVEKVFMGPVIFKIKKNKLTLQRKLIFFFLLLGKNEVSISL